MIEKSSKYLVELSVQEFCCLFSTNTNQVLDLPIGQNQRLRREAFFQFTRDFVPDIIDSKTALRILIIKK